MSTVGVQHPQILHLPGAVADLADALEAIELGEAYGPPLDLSQKITLVAGMCARVDGRWAATQVSDAESRQNGKGDTIQVRELWGLTQVGQQIIHTAHEFPTAAKAFGRLEMTLQSYDDLRREVKKIRYANGDQGVVFRNGGEISYRARTGGGGRGFDAVDLVVYDEAQHLQAEHMAASAPTTATSDNYQLWFAGSAGMAFSTVWWAQRIAALRDPGGDVPKIFRKWVDFVTSTGGRFAYIEHTAEQVSLNADGEVDSIEPDPFSVEARALANPAFGTRISPEFFDDQHRLLQELFPREHLGVWDPLPTATAIKREISQHVWDRQEAKESHIETRVGVGIAVAPEAESASIATAGERPDGHDHVELLITNPGTDWLIPRLQSMLAANPDIEVVAFDAAGPEKEVAPQIRQVCKAANVKLLELSTRQYAGACGAFVTGVVREGRVWHLEDDRLAGPIASGKRRVYGTDAWVWDNRVQSDVSPLKAITVALRASRDATGATRNREPLFAFS